MSHHPFRRSVHLALLGFGVQNFRIWLRVWDCGVRVDGWGLGHKDYHVGDVSVFTAAVCKWFGSGKKPGGTSGAWDLRGKESWQNTLLNSQPYPANSCLDPKPNALNPEPWGVLCLSAGLRTRVPPSGVLLPIRNKSKYAPR